MSIRLIIFGSGLNINNLIDSGSAVGVTLYKTRDAPETGGLGLSLGMVERLKWDEYRAGLVEVVEFSGGRREWSRFGCYVMVERFALKRLNGSLVISFDFYHAHQTMLKRE